MRCPIIAARSRFSSAQVRPLSGSIRPFPSPTLKNYFSPPPPPPSSAAAAAAASAVRWLMTWKSLSAETKGVVSNPARTEPID